MTKLRLVLLATTTLTAMQFVSPPSHAQTAPLVFAQAKEELGPDGKPKAPPKAAPPAAAPARPAPPPAAAPPPPPPRPVAPPPPPPPPAAAPPPRPAPPPAAAPPPPRPAPPPPPAAAPPPPRREAPAAPARPASPPPPPPPSAPKQPDAPTTPPPRVERPERGAPPPGARQQEQLQQQQKTTTTPTPVPTATPVPAATPIQRGEQRNGAPGGRLPQREPNTIPTPLSTATPTPTPSATPAPAATPRVEQKNTTPAERLQQKGAATPTSTATPTPAPTSTPAATPTSTSTPTPVPTGTPVPGATPVPGTRQPQRGSDVPAGTAPSPTPIPGGGAAGAAGGQGREFGQRRAPPTVPQPIPPAPPPAEGLKAIPQGAPAQQGAAAKLDSFRGQRQESQQGGRTVITEPGRVIVRDPGGQAFIRHNEVDRFRYGARDIRTQQVGNETRTIVIRPDGSQIITVNDREGQLLRRIRRDERGREIIIIDNSYRGPRGFGGFYVDLAPPVIRIPRDRYIVEAEGASPDLLYDTMMAPPVERIERRYSLDEVRYSASVRQRMPSIDLDSINFESGSWEIPPDQAAKLQGIADGLNRAIAANPRAVFLIEGHTDATGTDVDNLSLSDRRAESAATLLTQQFQVPAENLTSQGYGEQYLKEQTDGPSRINRRVTIRNITPLLNGGSASLPPPPPGTAPPR